MHSCGPDNASQTANPVVVMSNIFPWLNLKSIKAAELHDKAMRNYILYPAEPILQKNLPDFFPCRTLSLAV